MWVNAVRWDLKLAFLKEKRLNISHRIRARRMELGISQESLARSANVSLSLINQLERGVITDPHLSNLLRIASALNVTVSDLLDAPPPEPDPSGTSVRELAHVTAALADHVQTEI